jgi:hypothetical protein
MCGSDVSGLARTDATRKPERMTLLIKMPSRCKTCGAPLEAGDLIFQLAQGTYWAGWATPGYLLNPLSEWHGHCLDGSFPLRPQIAPCACLLCDQTIESGTAVVYMTHGYQPKVGYTAPEDERGYSMPFIAHESCFENTRPDILPPADQRT